MTTKLSHPALVRRAHERRASTLAVLYTAITIALAISVIGTSTLIALAHDIRANMVRDDKSARLDKKHLHRLVREIQGPIISLAR